MASMGLTAGDGGRFAWASDHGAAWAAIEAFPRPEAIASATIREYPFLRLAASRRGLQRRASMDCDRCRTGHDPRDNDMTITIAG